MNSTVYRILPPSRDSAWLHFHHKLPPPCTNTHSPTRTQHRVHACARHRQVLSNRRVLSIINVYRMRNRVQARPALPPTPIRPPFIRRSPPPAGRLRLRPPPSPRPFLRRALISRGAKALSWKFVASVLTRRRRFRVANARLSFGSPLITSLAFFPSRLFFTRARSGAERLLARRNERTNGRTDEGAVGVFLIFLLARAVLSFVTKPRPRREIRRAEGAGGGGAQGGEMIFSPELNYGRAMECACYSFAALRWWARQPPRRCNALCNPSDYDYFSD